ncbi:hypothetical protein R6242_21100 [Iodobacter sp. CM08]|uniref:hypothetical protein n=1 Tax=Iodobacter sp. CM08 TaxID=3085902 RepID=UPI0029826CBB|nr:hypothetical protein [Iodobacter sp. CM08]MDW5419073.1 hypothetical protein [Iodobacter sp. CM08]
MSNQKNEQWIVKFPKGDARRLFVLLAAIDALPCPTITTLSLKTGHNKGTIKADIKRLEQYGVDIELQGDVFRIKSWGDLLKKDSVRKYLRTSKNS